MFLFISIWIVTIHCDALLCCNFGKKEWYLLISSIMFNLNAASPLIHWHAIVACVQYHFTTILVFGTQTVGVKLKKTSNRICASPCSVVTRELSSSSSKSGK